MSGKSKHIETRYHYIRDVVAQIQVVLIHISISRLVADILTMPVARCVFQTHIGGIGLCKFLIFVIYVVCIYIDTLSKSFWISDISYLCFFLYVC